MKPVLVLVQASFRRFFANKGAVIITFLVPIVLIYLFGYVFGLHRSSRKGGGPSGITVAIVDQHKGTAASELISALKAERAFRIITDVKADRTTPARAITEDDARTAIRNNEYRYALILPADLIRTDSIGVRVKFIWDPRNDIEAQTVNGLLQRAIFTRAPRLLISSMEQRAVAMIGAPQYDAFTRDMADTIVRRFGGDPDVIRQQMKSAASPAAQEGETNGAPEPSSATTAGSGTDQDELTERLADVFKIETEQLVGKQVTNPMASRMVGGYAVMFLLFALSASAAAIFEEKSTGIFARILSAPVRASQILWARFFFGLILGTLQLGLLFIAGDLFFGLDLARHALPVFLATLAVSAACTAFGMLIAAIAPSAESVSGLTTLIVLPMTAIGGAWFPVSFMPEFIQKLSKLSIVYWAVEAYSAILWAGNGVAQVLPHLGILAAVAFVVMLVATKLFQRRDVFR